MGAGEQYGALIAQTIFGISTGLTLLRRRGERSFLRQLLGVQSPSPKARDHVNTHVTKHEPRLVPKICFRSSYWLLDPHV